MFYTRTTRLLNGSKNKPIRKFIDVNILKIKLVWAVKSLSHQQFLAEVCNTTKKFGKNATAIPRTL